MFVHCDCHCRYQPFHKILDQAEDASGEEEVPEAAVIFVHAEAEDEQWRVVGQGVQGDLKGLTTHPKSAPRPVPGAAVPRRREPERILKGSIGGGPPKAGCWLFRSLTHRRSSRTCSAPAERETSPALSVVEGFATPERSM